MASAAGCYRASNPTGFSARVPSTEPRATVDETDGYGERRLRPAALRARALPARSGGARRGGGGAEFGCVARAQERLRLHAVGGARGDHGQPEARRAGG